MAGKGCAEQAVLYLWVLPFSGIGDCESYCTHQSASNISTEGKGLAVSYNKPNEVIIIAYDSVFARNV